MNSGHMPRIDRKEPAELVRRAQRVLIAEAKLAQLSFGVADVDLLRRIEEVHAEVEAVERRLAGVWFPVLAVVSRRRLRTAEVAEQRVLAAAGFASWLGMQLYRVDVLVDKDAIKTVSVVEVERRDAIRAWRELVGEADPRLVVAEMGQKVSSPHELHAAVPRRFGDGLVSRRNAVVAVP
jgi:hypothetical protein